ncbi:hypothetical protein KY289_037069 [Solanum tuberosum]|nr:hypothetical protein KY289_037069 [Solanum tuberosum]
MKNAGIPFESINIHDTTGNAWWTFKIAQMFIITDGHGTFSPIVTLRAEDVSYQTRLDDITDGAPFRAFAALCGGPSEEWNEYAYID